MDRVTCLTEQLKAKVPAEQRAVFVLGARTPFTRAFTDMTNADTITLARAAVRGVLSKSKIDPSTLDHIVWGGVLIVNGSPNTAREVIIDEKLPPTISAHTESMACASGMKAIISAVDMIETGNATAVIAGGSEAMSGTDLVMAREVTQGLALYQAGKVSLSQFLSTAGLPCSWMPNQPTVSERSTGKTMGYHADVMAQLCSVTRHAQDEFALRSHKNASAARKAGLFNDEVVPVEVPKGPYTPAKTVTRDTLIRDKQDAAKMASLKPVFRKAQDGGSITAGTASPLTDGAAACLIMSAGEAKKQGLAADVGLRSWAASGIAPEPNLLLAPALAIPVALRRAGLTLGDIDFFEFHEAFAGQVLATINVLKSDELCRKFLNLEGAVGTVDMERVNVHGSSVSIGHPFGATGVRLATNATRLLRSNPQSKYVLVSICAAGGLGLVSIFERV